MAIAIRVFLSLLELPLLERLFWASMTARLLATAALVWAGLLLNVYAERYFYRRSSGAAAGGSPPCSASAAGPRTGCAGRGGADYRQLLRGRSSPALAGLGIGGIAVALAAQKTLENVIGGVSIIFDKAVGVGDFLKIGDMLGTVDSIGLRSTRIRTLDRTILTVPNGMIASVNVETISARDKFWFHHYIGLRYETTAAQVRAILGDVRDLLRDHPRVDSGMVRARFIRLGPFSIDIEVFTYLFARDWDEFLVFQEALPLEVIDIVERRGAVIALPSHTVHVEAPGALPPPHRGHSAAIP